MTAALASAEFVAVDERNARRGVARVDGLPPIRYEVCGNPHGPTVLVLGGISASRHVTANSLDPSPGWWENTVGPGRAIDPANLSVIGIDYVTNARKKSTTGARPDRLSQSELVESHHSAPTTFDQAVAINAVLDAIGVRKLGAIVGASYGGMIALAFAEHYPERVERIVVISAAHESDPMATALRSIQRRVVELGEHAGAAREGIALARALAMTTYRTRAEFAERFSNIPSWKNGQPAFPAEEYVVARGEAYADRTTADDFRALTLSLDLHSVTPEKIRVPATLIAVREDQLVPIEKIRELHRLLGARSHLVELSSVHGHDAFLADAELLARTIAEALASSNSAFELSPPLP